MEDITLPEVWVEVYGFKSSYVRCLGAESRVHRWQSEDLSSKNNSRHSGVCGSASVHDPILHIMMLGKYREGKILLDLSRTCLGERTRLETRPGEAYTEQHGLSSSNIEQSGCGGH